MGRRTRKPGSVGDAIVNSKSELKPLWDFLRAATKRNLQANLARQFDIQIGRTFASSASGHKRLISKIAGRSAYASVATKRPRTNAKGQSPRSW
jgi:hypothetical protein